MTPLDLVPASTSPRSRSWPHVRRWRGYRAGRRLARLQAFTDQATAQAT
jgi:hypothetical protein